MDRWSSLIFAISNIQLYTLNIQLYTLNYRIFFSDTTINLEKVKDTYWSQKNGDGEKWVLLSVKGNLCHLRRSTWVKRWRTVLWIHKVCSLTCHFVTGLTILIFRLVTALCSFGMTAQQCGILTVSEIVKWKLVFAFSFPHPQELLSVFESTVWLLQDNQQWILLFFIPERLINGGNGRESELLNSSIVCCHCLNSSWIWGYERDLLEE